MHTYTGGMSLEEQVGQVLMAGFWGDRPSQEIIDLIQRYHVGNIILFSRNIRDTRQVLELTSGLQQIAKEAGHRYPLLIAIDQENGIVQRLGEAATIFPGNMAMGAIGSEEIAYQVALATGRELKALGINMNLAPVVDVNNNLANSVIGVRSFGENPQNVARLGAAMVRGYQEAGILSCLKHFPGHGDTATDSHLALPTIPHTLERLETVELVPFRRGIEVGAASVMIAHVAFPALTQHETLPATVSSAIVQGLLRQRLDFHGLILSDCMEMRAVAEMFGTGQAAVLALHAGVDLVLVSHHYTKQQGSIEAILTSAKTEKHTVPEVQRAAERVLSHKAQTLSWDDVFSIDAASATIPACIGCEAHVQLQRRAYELSTTLVRNEDALLPLHLNAGERIVLLSPHRNATTMVEDRYYSDQLLASILEMYHTRVEIASIYPGPVEDACRELLQAARESDVFIVATVNAHQDQQQAALVRSLISSLPRMIVIAVRDPYDLQAFPQLHTYLATYEYTRPALLAAAHVLFGQTLAQGHLPVSL